MSKYTDEFKLKVVQEYVESTIGIRFLADKYGLAENVLRLWCQRYRIHGVFAFEKSIVLIRLSLNSVFFNTRKNTTYHCVRQLLILTCVVSSSCIAIKVGSIRIDDISNCSMNMG